MIRLSEKIDQLSRAVGRAASWLILAAVLVSAGNAIMRKAFSLSSNAWLELQWYLYGAAFLCAASWVLERNQHVRIDVVAGRFSVRVKTWIELIGHVVFLLPMSLMIIYLAWPWFLRSFLSGETSANAGGLILWPAKSLVLVGFALLALQTLSEILKLLSRLIEPARARS